MGAHFRLPVIETGWAELETILRNPARPLALLAAESEEGVACWQADLKRALALAVGGEAEGVSPQTRALAESCLRIPMPGGSESLNAAVAAAVLMFEVTRQRSL